MKAQITIINTSKDIKSQSFPVILEKIIEPDWGKNTIFIPLNSEIKVGFIGLRPTFEKTHDISITVAIKAPHDVIATVENDCGDIWLDKAPELTEFEKRIIEVAQDYENAFTRRD